MCHVFNTDHLWLLICQAFYISILASCPERSLEAGVESERSVETSHSHFAWEEREIEGLSKVM